MRVIPTFLFYGTRTVEPKSSPGREKCEIVQSYRSFTGYRSITLHETTWYASHHFRNLRPVHEGKHNPLIRIHRHMIHQGIPQRFIEVHRYFLQFRQSEQNAAENHGCGFHGFLPFQQGFVFRFLFFILPGQICVLLRVRFFCQIIQKVFSGGGDVESSEIVIWRKSCVLGNLWISPPTTKSNHMI